MAYRTPIVETDESILENIDSIPEICPSCGKGIQPKYISSVFQHPDVDRDHTTCQVVFACPLRQCGRAFIAHYTQTKYGRPDGRFYLYRTYRLDYVEWEKFSDTIKKISPTFDKIYNQSKVADENGMDMVCGPGYRKALEFLVKDYLLLKKPDLKTFIESNQLGPIIGYIDDTHIKATAKRAAWLGNDETHYKRKWVEKDISDLKNLIKMTVDWIDLVERSEEVLKDMPDGSKE